MKFTTFAIAISLFLTSCNRYYYRPNSVQAPLLAAAGDAHIVATATPFESEEVDDTNAKNHVISVQASVSPVKYLGLIGSFTNYRYKITANPDPEEGLVDGKANVWEVGAGGYYPFVEKPSGFKFLADCYLGYGAGKLTSDVDMKFNKIFIQPGIGVRMPYFDAAFNLRFTGMKYSDLNAKGRPDSYLYDHDLTTPTGSSITDSRNFFVEPSFTVRGGYKFVKVQMQYVFAQALQPTDWNYNESLFTVGLYLGLEEFWKKGQK